MYLNGEMLKMSIKYSKKFIKNNHQKEKDLKVDLIIKKNVLDLFHDHDQIETNLNIVVGLKKKLKKENIELFIYLYL